MTEKNTYNVSVYFQLYLKTYQYLGESRTGREDVKEAIKSFQTFFRLEVTGELNDETITIMNKPRCGNPDIVANPGRFKRYVTGGRWYKWRKDSLTYYFQPGNDFDKKSQRRIIKQAFDMWARYTNFKFTAVDYPDRADIKIRYLSINLYFELCYAPKD